MAKEITSFITFSDDAEPGIKQLVVPETVVRIEQCDNRGKMCVGDLLHLSFQLHFKLKGKVTKVNKFKICQLWLNPPTTQKWELNAWDHGWRPVFDSHSGPGPKYTHKKVWGRVLQSTFELTPEELQEYKEVLAQKGNYSLRYNSFAL